MKNNYNKVEPIAVDYSKSCMQNFHKLELEQKYNLRLNIVGVTNRHEPEKVTEVMCLFLTVTDYLYKVAVLWIKHDEIEEIIEITKGPIFNQGEMEHKPLLMNTVRESLLVVGFYNCMGLFTCMLWSIRPILERFNGKVDLPIWLPYNPDQNPHFYVTIFYMWIQISMFAIANSLIDGLIAFFLEQCKTQITIIKLDLQSLVAKCELEKKKSSAHFSDILETKLKKIIIHHREIVTMAGKVQDIFGNAVFYQFVSSGLILCTSAYTMTTADPASLEFISMVFYIMCMLIQLLFYCYYGSKLTYESDKLMEFSYATDWLSFSVKHRRTLIIFMERIKYPIKPTVGALIPLSNNTFVSIVRSSYTLYTILKNSQNTSAN
ncbi:odorant receptor Or1-like [Amyelois transitella]|uniref:odorant receptor Or1-like n=1 Tax=Amyelois transitella TaxID=680683 RepID=UPI0029902FB6|nr:odorant receptor Or1-like [Amyelois transitella]